MLVHIQLLMHYHLVSSSISWYLIISVYYFRCDNNDTVLFCLVHAMLGFGLGMELKLSKFLYRYIWVIELQCIFFFFFLKTNLECNSYYKDETLETNFYTCHTQKSYSFYYFELEATYIETVSLVK